jgi:hypothetical protein
MSWAGATRPFLHSNLAGVFTWPSSIMQAVFHVLQGKQGSTVKHIELNRQAEAIKQFFLTLPVDPDGSLVELDG